MSLHLESPPINEVVVATYFNPPLSGLRSEHIGLFWNVIREQFPTVQQQLPSGVQPGQALVGSGPEGGELFPLPRYWFIAADDIMLLQIQKNAFMLNWRSRDKEYPGFASNIKPAFDKYYAVYSDFVRAEIDPFELTISSCELTYINAVNQSELWSGVRETGRVIPSFSFPDLMSGRPDLAAFNCTYVYSSAPDLQLQVGIRNGHLTDQPDVPVLVFELKAIGRPEPANKSTANAWFERAHRTIAECFLELTDQDVQTKFWKRTEMQYDD